MPVELDPDSTGPYGITLDDLVARVRRELSDKDELNRLTTAIDETATSISLEFNPEGLTRNSQISVGNEVMHVWSIAGKTLEVERGYGTPASAHPAKELVSANSKTRAQIVDAINDELASLSTAGLYQMRSLELTGTHAAQTVEVPELTGADFYEVQYRASTLDDSWFRVKGVGFDPMNNVLQLGGYGGFGTLRVLYKAPFSRLINGTDDIQQVAGLHGEAADILVYGAAWRLTVSEELKRNDFRTQGDTRRADEVPYRAMALARRDFKELRDQRLAEEKDRLRRRFPLTKAGH